MRVAAMAKKNLAEILVDTLVAAGVKRVYGLAGDSLNGITDAIRTDERIKWIHVRHEETAAFAAGAEAHLTGTLGSTDYCWRGSISNVLHALHEGPNGHPDGWPLQFQQRRGSIHREPEPDDSWLCRRQPY